MKLARDNSKKRALYSDVYDLRLIVARRFCGVLMSGLTLFVPLTAKGVHHQFPEEIVIELCRLACWAVPKSENIFNKLITVTLQNLALVSKGWYAPTSLPLSCQVPRNTEPSRVAEFWSLGMPPEVRNIRFSFPFSHEIHLPCS